MKFFMLEGGGRKRVGLDQLSDLNLHQMGAIADGLGRLIPHEGVDFDITVMGNATVGIKPLTDKGEEWREYVMAVSKTTPPDISAGPGMKSEFAAYLGGLIPADGIDYDPVLVFTDAHSQKLNFSIEAHTERGRLWRDYVSKLLKKYPPNPNYKAELLPWEPEPVIGIPDEFKEAK